MMLHTPRFLVLPAQRRQNMRWCSNSSLNQPWQLVQHPWLHRRCSGATKPLVSHSSSDQAANTSQAVPTNPAAGSNSQAVPAGQAGAAHQPGNSLQPHTSTSHIGSETQQEHAAASSCSTQPGAGLAAEHSAAKGSSASTSNGNSAKAESAATPAAASSSSSGDYILFTADDLLQGTPTSGKSNISSSSNHKSEPNPSSSTSNNADTSTSSSSTGSPSSGSSAGAASTSQTNTSSPAAEQQSAPAQDQQQHEHAHVQQQDQQQQQQKQQGHADVPPLPTNLTVAVGPADEATDEGPFPAQQVFVPPPLIDPDVDIANDPAYAIRLMDILDQIASSSSSSSQRSSSGSVCAAPSLDQAQEAAGAPPSSQQQQQQQLRFTRQPAAFCTNCCTPLDPLRPSSSCSTCGHFASDDHLLFSQGVSSLADLAAHTPPWLLLQQQKQGAAPGSAAAAVKAGIWRRQQQQQQDDAQTQAAAAGSSQQDQQQAQDSAGADAAQTSGNGLDAAVVQQRAEAAALLRQAQKQLQEAGVLKLPKTLLAWEDESAQGGEEPAMHLHRGLLPPNHERPERLRVIEARLRAAGLIDCCERLPPVEASDAELLAVHTPGLIAAVAALSHANTPSDLNRVAEHMAPDTLGNRFTHRAARTAAGTAAEMARRLVLGQADNGMALIRPLGHAAGINTTEAGAYYNNVAVAVRAAQHAGARRVMVIDWDIHHCKGTEEIFAEDPNVVVLSLHKYGSSYYPGTGAATDIGVGRGRGRTINVAWSPPIVMDKRGRRVQVDAPPVSDGDYLTAWHMLVLPVVAEFRPDLILVSAGFDAVDKDPLGHYRVHPECFGHLTALLKPHAPLGLLLEGGYNLSATAACVEACLRVLLGERPAPLRGTRYAGVTGWSSVLRTLLVHQEHWQSLGLLNFLQLASTPPAGPGEWEEDEGLELAGQEWEEEGEEEYEDTSDEQELQEAELEDALAVAALAAQAGPKGAAAGAAADTPAQLQQLLSAAQQDDEFMQELLQLLEQRKAEKAAEAQSKQQREQREQRAAEAAAAEASAAFEAGRAAAIALKAAAAGKAEATTAAADSSSTPGTGTAATTSSSSSSSGGDSFVRGGSWSAGGFLEDASAVDSGSEDELGVVPYNALSSTDWGWQQLDEESQDNMPWFEVEEVQQQLKKAEQDAAAAMAAAAAASAAAAAAVEATTDAPVAEQAAAAIHEAAVAAVTAEATIAVAVEAAKEAEEAAAAALAAAAAATEHKHGAAAAGADSQQGSSSSSGSSSALEQQH